MHEKQLKLGLFKDYYYIWVYSSNKNGEIKSTCNTSQYNGCVPFLDNLEEDWPETDIWIPCAIDVGVRPGTDASRGQGAVLGSHRSQSAFLPGRDLVKSRQNARFERAVQVHQLMMSAAKITKSHWKLDPIGQSGTSSTRLGTRWTRASLTRSYSTVSGDSASAASRGRSLTAARDSA